MAAKSATCPACGDTFKDLRGLNGHLRFKHQFEKERVDELMDEAKRDVSERREAEGEKPADSVMLAMDRMVRAQDRKELAEDVLKRMKKKNFVGDRWELGFLTSTIPEKEVAEEYVEKCEEELEEAKEALYAAIEREANRREAQNS